MQMKFINTSALSWMTCAFAGGAGLRYRSPNKHYDGNKSMNRLLAFGYVLIGFIAGLAFGVGTGTDLTLTLQRFAYFVGALILIGLWQWFEESSHHRHVARWERYISRGKWNFIATHYVLARGFTVLLFIVLPFIGKVHFTTDSMLVLVVTAVIGLSAMAFLGYQEWAHCQQDFEIRSLREAAQRAKQ